MWNKISRGMSTLYLLVSRGFAIYTRILLYCMSQQQYGHQKVLSRAWKGFYCHDITDTRTRTLYVDWPLFWCIWYQGGTWFRVTLDCPIQYSQVFDLEQYKVHEVPCTRVLLCTGFILHTERKSSAVWSGLACFIRLEATAAAAAASNIVASLVCSWRERNSSQLHTMTS